MPAAAALACPTSKRELYLIPLLALRRAARRVGPAPAPRSRRPSDTRVAVRRRRLRGARLGAFVTPSSRGRASCPSGDVDRPRRARLRHAAAVVLSRSAGSAVLLLVGAVAALLRARSPRDRRARGGPRARRGVARLRDRGPARLRPRGSRSRAPRAAGEAAAPADAPRLGGLLPTRRSSGGSRTGIGSSNSACGATPRRRGASRPRRPPHLLLAKEKHWTRDARPRRALRRRPAAPARPVWKDAVGGDVFVLLTQRRPLKLPRPVGGLQGTGVAVRRKGGDRPPRGYPRPVRRPRGSRCRSSTPARRATRIALSVVLARPQRGGQPPRLWDELRRGAARLGTPAEVLFVNDGSTDGSGALLDGFRAGDPRVRVIDHDRNHGLTAALDCGFRHARGAVIAMLDADLQNPPGELEKLCAACPRPTWCIGWRKDRRDPFVKRVSSKIANGYRNWRTNEQVHDTGCALKVFQREVIERIKLWKGMHRFLPTLARMEGFRVVEVPVAHRPRPSGTSHFGVWNRLWKGLADVKADPLDVEEPDHVRRHGARDVAAPAERRRPGRDRAAGGGCVPSCWRSRPGTASAGRGRPSSPGASLEQWIASGEGQASVIPPAFWAWSLLGIALLSSTPPTAATPCSCLGTLVNGGDLRRATSGCRARRSRAGRGAPALWPLVGAASLLFGAVTIEAVGPDHGLVRFDYALPAGSSWASSAALWSGRFVVQWWTSERLGRRVPPGGVLLVGVVGAPCSSPTRSTSATGSTCSPTASVRCPTRATCAPRATRRRARQRRARRPTRAAARGRARPGAPRRRERARAPSLAARPRSPEPAPSRGGTASTCVALVADRVLGPRRSLDLPPRHAAIRGDRARDDPRGRLARAPPARPPVPEQADPLHLARRGPVGAGRGRGTCSGCACRARSRCVATGLATSRVGPRAHGVARGGAARGPPRRHDSS